MLHLFYLISGFLFVVAFITVLSINIEVAHLKGRGKFVGFLFGGLPFVLGIIIYIIGAMIIGPLHGTKNAAPLITLIVWIIGFITSILGLKYLKPTEENAKRVNQIRKILSFKEIMARFFIYLELSFVCGIILVPIIWVIGASFNARGGIGWKIWPDQISLANYKALLKETKAGTTEVKIEFVSWYWNTLKIALATCAISVVFITLVAYVFARFKFKGKKFGLLSILILQMFPSFMGLIALYNLFRIFGLLEKPMALTLVYVAGAIPYNTWLVKGYLQNIPKSLDESARIDGASNIQIFTKIIFPLSAPIITFLAISMFMSPWMDFMLPRLVITKTNKQTLAIGLYNLINNRATYFSQFAAGAVLVGLPITILYASLQRYLIEGITAGANKG